MAGKMKVLMLQAIHEEGIKLFDDRFEVVVAKDPSPAAVIKELDGVQAMIVRVAPCPREIIEAAPDLKVIAKHGVGPDNIDVAAATKRGILVLNTPDANAVSVAEHTVTAIGALAKRALYMDKAMRAGNWSARGELKAMDLDSKTLGLVGTGRIGTQVALKAQAAFNMQIMAYDPFVKPELAAANGIRLVDDLAVLFREADVVSVHTPLTPQTRGMVSAELIAAMKSTAFLINFARGEVVDEAALIQALTAERIAGAALDVFQKEPIALDNPLLKLENVLLSPHSAAQTRECVIRMSTTTAQGVIDALTGKRPRYVFNPEALSVGK